MKETEIKKIVREGYAKIAKDSDSCCNTTNSCCGSANLVETISKNVGYSDNELRAVPKGANLGLGCGNPVALASLKEGEIVLDLGSGAGFDCFLAAKKVGKTGKVIGVDMTPEMMQKARENAAKGNYRNVEFRLGDIDNLPVADHSVDVIISNCVINLSPNKEKVFREAFRVLKPSGRLMVSDIVLLKTIPEVIRNSIEAYVGCISGAIMKDEYIAIIQAVGFQEISVVDEQLFPIDCIVKDSTAQAIIRDLEITPPEINELANSILSIQVQAFKSAQRL